jgi:hypothetical protein
VPVNLWKRNSITACHVSIYLQTYREAQAYQEEAPEVASVCKHIFEHNPIVVASVCFLLMEILRLNLLEFRLDIRVASREFSEACEVVQSLFGFAVVDEVARRFRDKWDHDANQGAWDELDAFTLSFVVACGLNILLTN